MTRYASRKPLQWRWMTPIALFTLAALAVGAQALVPAPAGAFQTECTEWWASCQSADTGDDGKASWEGTSWNTWSKTPPPPTRSPFEPGYGNSQQPGDGDGHQDSGSRSIWARAKLKVKRVECGRLREKIRGRIEDLYGSDSIFDEVVNSGDQKLDRLQAAWRESGCEDIKR